MTVQTYTATAYKCAQGIGAPTFGYLVTWASMANGDSGTPTDQNLMPWLDRTFQITGTFGSGGTVLIEGTNDLVNYYTLTDPQGNALSVTTAGIHQVTEVVVAMRPRVSAGDGTTAIVVTGFFRSTYPR